MTLAVSFLVLFGMVAIGGDRNGVPPQPDVADERQARRNRSWDEIRQIVAEAHALLPRHEAQAVGAAYARYSSRYQDSVADQIRTIVTDAVRKGIFIPLENVFLDLAVRGVKYDRPGLNDLRACLGRKDVRVVFFFATNRLFRKTYRSLQFVEEEVVEKGVRAVFVKSGVDTADGKRWRGLLSMHAMMDEFVVGTTADHVRAAHEGLLDKRLVFGTISFGYAGRPLGGQTTRRGKPRQALVVDPVAGECVRRVFGWYVRDRLSLNEIVRRLNGDPAVPPPPKSPHRVWTHDAVRKLLRNPRYRGCWRYGVTETVWVSSKDYARQVERDEPLKEVQIEELRLVPDDQWYAAQSLLAKEAEKVVGRKPRDGDASGRPRVLNGLFYCPTHNRKLYVGGVHGKYLICRDCHGVPADQRPLYSQLPRALALRKTCETLAGMIRGDADLVRQVVEACRRHAAEQPSVDTDRRTALEGRQTRIDQQIKFILRNPGETDTDKQESESELRRLRKERAQVQTELDALRAVAERTIAIPTGSEVAELVTQLAEILMAGVTESESAGLVRELVDRLTGGRIDLEQAGERKARRGWLRGRFRCRLLRAMTGRLTSVDIPTLDAGGDEVVIDYSPDPTGVPEAVSSEVIRLYDAGLLEREIARRLRLGRSTVTRTLDAWDAARGQERPDGRSRRMTLPEKHLAPPVYQEVAERVKGLADRGLLFGDIASELDLDRNTVTAAWRFWHTSRGLPVPDGRTRRKTLHPSPGTICAERPPTVGHATEMEDTSASTD